MALEPFSFVIGMAAGLGLAAIFVWARRPRVSLDHPPAFPPRPLDPALERDVWDLVSRGRKIEAIKLVREATGCDLKTAKERVEQSARGE
jgi:hypothetical protein